MRDSDGPNRIYPLHPEPIDTEAFQPFGWIPVADTDSSDGVHTLKFEWADPHVNLISHGAEEIERHDGALLCDKMFRHKTHTQALLVLDVDAVVAVAPAALGFTAAEDADSVRAFLLRPLDAFVLDRGTWHWGPFPVGAAPVHLYNVQGLRYADDNDCVDLSDFGFEVQV